jgi:hypothetical protein
MPFDMKTAKPGDRVWWSDPADGLSSGEYTIIEVYADSPEERDSDTMVLIRNGSGSEAEVIMGELCAPDDRPRTAWKDVRSWDAAMAASALARGSDEDYPWHDGFDSHIFHDNPIVSLMANLLLLAHFDGDEPEEVLRNVLDAFRRTQALKGEVDYTPNDKGRTEWAHRTLCTWAVANGADRLQLMGRLARLGDQEAEQVSGDHPQKG